MIRSAILSLLLFGFFTMQAQTTDWVVTIPSGNTMNPFMVNSYMVVNHDNEIIFSGLKDNGMSYSPYLLGDHWLLKYNSAGQLISDSLVLQGNVVVEEIAVFPDNDLLLRGMVYDSLETPDGTLILNTGSKDFIMHMDQDFNLIDWEMFDELIDVSVNPSGGYTVIYRDYISFDQRIRFVDNTGMITDSLIIEGLGFANSLDIDQEGNMYISGSCADQQVVIGADTINSMGVYNIFTLKINDEQEFEYLINHDHVTCPVVHHKLIDDELFFLGNAIDSVTLGNHVIDGSEFFGVGDGYVGPVSSTGELDWLFQLNNDAGNMSFVHFKYGAFEKMGNNYVLAGQMRGDSIMLDGGFYIHDTVMTAYTALSPVLISLNNMGEVQAYKVIEDGADYTVYYNMDADANDNIYLSAMIRDTFSIDNFEIEADYYNQKFVLVRLSDGSSNAVAESLSEELRIYPNPVTNSLSIELPGLEEGFLSVYDVSGKLLRQVKNNQSTDILKLDVSDLMSGIYIIKYQGKNSNLEQRFIKQ